MLGCYVDIIIYIHFIVLRRPKQWWNIVS